MLPLPRMEDARQALADGSGKGVRIAVLDSGIETAHPALAGLELSDDLQIVERNFRLATEPGNGKDLYGHGTAIAHLIRTVAPQATIGSIRVLGERLYSRSAIIQEGARVAIERGYHILNCSFGCGIEDHVLLYKQWVDEAYVRGVHIVSACNNLDFETPEWPGFFPSVLTVNAVAAPDPALFYSRQKHMVEFAAGGIEVDVPWLGASTKRVTGSSYAAPRITGMLARLLSCYPSLTTLEAKVLMQRLALPLPPEWDEPMDLVGEPI
ncbi:MAG: S8 family serine peptidase [Candidatus Methylacidiphilales bacterium]|nr:S8 family serine peptidase [Candidatus Methylacidiphilales bacterium]